jgi:hypothetical protein
MSDFGWPRTMPLWFVGHKTLRPNYELAALFFFLSRVSQKGEFYLERFLMKQHCTKTAHFDNHVHVIII